MVWTEPDLVPADEISGLRYYATRDVPISLSAARRVLQCSVGLGGEEQGDLIAALYRAEDKVRACRRALSGES